METSNCKDVSGDLVGEKNYFSCISCKMSFKTSKELLKHNRQAHQRRDFYCTSCGKNFLREKYLKKHVTICNGEKQQFSCSQCGLILGSMNKLNSHIKKHAFEAACDRCSVTFKSEEDLNKHNELHEGRHYIECDFCETICFDEIVLQRHLATHKAEKQKITPKEGDKSLKCKPPIKGKLFKCPYCKKRFSLIHCLNAHAKVCHSGKLKCSNVEKKQETQSGENLQIDEPGEQSAKSLDDKPPIVETFKCYLCRKNFCSQIKLAHHLKICKRNRYKCYSCRKGYPTDKKLENHVCSCKTDIYKCNVCNLAFNLKEDLFKHFFVHKSMQGTEVCL